MIKPFDFPEIDELFKELFSKLFKESGRGAILIVTAHVEDFLTDLIKAILPTEANKVQQNRLFNYPGTLSSLSSKIELAYAFRLISKNLYESLNALRKIRNDAAHSNGQFDLNELNQKMKQVYNLGEGAMYVINKISTEMMVKSKFNSLEAYFDDKEITSDNRKKYVQEILENKELMSSIEKQLPHWELLNGVCLICGMIFYEKVRIAKITNDINILSDLLPKGDGDIERISKSYNSYTKAEKQQANKNA